MSKLVLIDGHSILNRAFYGVPLLTNGSGLHTNAVYGFLNIMFKILEEEKPEFLAVAFDVKAPTFRHEMYKEYKGTRKPMPEELREQVPVIRELLQAMGIMIMEQPGLEADDILGTMAKKAAQSGMEVALISGDRDLLQIADEKIKIRIPKTKGGGRTEVEDYYPQDVVEKYGVTPTQFIDLKALMGDTADNIPGVPKVGEKTATDLIKNYGSIDGVYANLENITKQAIRTSLQENEHLARLSLALATIEIHADIPFLPEQGKVGNFYTKEAYEICQRLELKSLLSRFDTTVTKPEAEVNVIEITALKEAAKVFEQAGKAKSVALHVMPVQKGQETEPVQLSLFETAENQDTFSGLALSFEEGKAYFIGVQKDITSEHLQKLVQELYQGGTVISCFDVKKLYPILLDENKKGSQEACANLFDVLIGAYLLNPLKNDYEICDISGEYLGSHFMPFKQQFPKMDRESAYRQKKEEYIAYMGREAEAICRVMPLLDKKLTECGMKNIFTEIEMPLSLVLYEMEQTGIIVKPDELRSYGEELQEKIDTLEKSVKEAAGVEFNINSPKQLGEVLFEKMQLPGGKKTKSGYSTAADVLEGLANEYPIVADILEYRGLAKLKSTYADGLGAQIGEDGRIHTNFHQTITATGRISSSEPNLQNIPIRTEMGRLIRKVFVPAPGHVLMDADYSQIELRILAHMSGDEPLIEAYRLAEDIHTMTASKVFHVPLEEVTPLQRRNAKAVNFGIVYGISAFGLAQDLGISKKEADSYIKEYFNTYPGIKNFLDNTVKESKEQGYSLTLYGRRRPIPELASSNFMQRSFGERVAMNAPIQGTAADIMKIAMIHVRDRLLTEGLRSQIIIQVHDELLLEVPMEETDKAAVVLREEMEKAASLAVNLEVDLHTGENWYEAK